MEIGIQSQRLEVFFAGFYEVFENEGITQVVRRYKTKAIVVEIDIAIRVLVSTPWVGWCRRAVYHEFALASMTMDILSSNPELVAADDDDGEGALYCAVSIKSMVSWCSAESLGCGGEAIAFACPPDFCVEVGFKLKECRGDDDDEWDGALVRPQVMTGRYHEKEDQGSARKHGSWV